MKRLISLALGALIVVSLVPAPRAHAAAGMSPVHAAAIPEHTVLVGLGQLEVSQGTASTYTPTYLDVTAGDTVLWRSVDQLEPHTVSFGPMAMLKDLARKDQFVPIPQKGGPPTLAFNSKVAFPTPGKTYNGTGFASSGILQKGNTWSLMFTTPGTFEYICLVHGEIMHGYVIVHAAQPQGAMYMVQAGDGMQALNDPTNASGNDAFYPYTLTIHVGNTVQWIGAFHTVSFGPKSMLNNLKKNLIVAVPQKGGPPLLELNPKISWPSGGSTYDGTGFVNSGVLALNTPPGSKAPPSFKLTFTKAGTYQYVCLVHPGMEGTVTVLP